VISVTRSVRSCVAAGCTATGKAVELAVIASLDVVWSCGL
jgi:hypothetical protein